MLLCFLSRRGCNYCGGTGNYPPTEGRGSPRVSGQEEAACHVPGKGPRDPAVRPGGHGGQSPAGSAGGARGGREPRREGRGPCVRRLPLPLESVPFWSLPHGHAWPHHVEKRPRSGVGPLLRGHVDGRPSRCHPWAARLLTWRLRVTRPRPPPAPTFAGGTGTRNSNPQYQTRPLLSTHTVLKHLS